MAHTLPSRSRIGPRESPWHTELADAVNVVCSVNEVTAVMVATPARSVDVTPAMESFPQPARVAFSPTRASRLSSSGTGVRPMSSGVSTTPASNAVLFASRQLGSAANDVATSSGTEPRNTLTEVAGGCRQCAAVRMARGAITVPEHEPTCWPPLSFMFKRTTGELAVEHSTPLTIAVDADTV